jgi:hypothetical protein
MSIYAIVASVIAIGATFLLLIRLKTGGREPDVDLATWLEGFSLDAYAPLDRLLNDESDFAFLASQPGYQPELGKELRRERRAIAREYLRYLTGDFRRLQQIAKLMVVYAREDSSPLAISLWRMDIRFYLALGLAHLRLMRFPLAKHWNSRLVLGQLASLYHDVHPSVAAFRA